jgi:hypothetical protein
MPQSWDMGHIILLPLRRKAYWGFFECPKNPTASAGFEPANSGSSGQYVNHYTTEAIIFIDKLIVVQRDKESHTSRASLNFFTLSKEFYHSNTSQTGTVFKIHWPATLSCIHHIVHYVTTTGLICWIYIHQHACYTSGTHHYISVHCMLVSKKN